MRPPTGRQYADALALISRIAASRRQLNRLDRELELFRMASEASERAYSRRLAFFADPDLLSGVTGFLRGKDKEVQAMAERHYDVLLAAMTQGPAQTRRRVDFHSLRPEARPYLLGPYLGVDVGGATARLCFARSDPDLGLLHYVVAGGPACAENWRPRLGEIAEWLGGSWTIAAAEAGAVTLMRRAPLPEIIAFEPSMLRAGALFAGIDVATQRPVHIPFSALSSGTFIPGASGTGKTAALHVLIRSLFANLGLFEAVWLVDGKDGVGMARYADRDAKVRVLFQEETFWALAADLAATIRARNQAQRAQGIENATGEFIAVVVDELPTFIAKPAGDARKEHAAFLDNLNSLAMRGRSAGLRLFFVSQSPVAEQIPVTLRSNCLTTIAFRVPETSHATMLFGQLDGLLTDPRRLPRGQALLQEGLTGCQTHVQFPLAPLPPIRRAPCSS